MKAFYQTSYKKADSVNYGELPDAVAGPNQLLVEVKFVSINPVDYKIRNGDLKFLVGSKFPKIVGSDFSGIVKETGPGVIEIFLSCIIMVHTTQLKGNMGSCCE